MRILVAEDQDAIRKMIEVLVSARGHSVVFATNGARAIELALRESLDLVLLDLHLPGQFDGFEVCKRLRSNERTSTLPIFVISAMADDASKARAKSLGATAYYTKPFSPMALLKDIETARTALGGEPSPSTSVPQR